MYEDRLQINPGSATGAYSTTTTDVKPSFVLMDLDGSKVGVGHNTLSSVIIVIIIVIVVIIIAFEHTAPVGGSCLCQQPCDHPPVMTPCSDHLGSG
jgi:hypothetical protein